MRSSGRFASLANGLLSVLGVLAAAAAPVNAQSTTTRASVASLPNGLESPPAPSPAAPGGCGERRLAEGLSEPPSCYLSSGEFHVEATDLRIAGRGFDFAWTRTYRSRFGPSSAQGHGWDFAYDVWIDSVGGDVVVHDGGGRVDRYAPRANGKYAAVELFREGEFLPNGTFKLVFADSGAWNFNALGASPSSGKLASIVDRNGNSLQLAYDAQGRLTTILDTLLRPITIAYDASGRISTVTDFASRQVKYTYYQAGDAGGGAGDLETATSPAVLGTPNGNDFPQGKTTTYTYSKGFADERLNHNLLTIKDPKGQTWLQNTYAASTSPAALAFDRVVEQRRGNAADTLEFTYVSLLPKPLSDASPEVLRCIVNDRAGFVHEYLYDVRGRCVAQRDFTGRAPDPSSPTTATLNRPVNKLRPDDPAIFETRWAYNADSLATLTIHPNLNQTQRVHELELNPNAAWRTRGNLRELHRLPGGHSPVGDQPELVESFQHLAGFGSCCTATFLTSHVDPRGFETAQTFDARGNLTSRTAPSGEVEDWEYNVFGQTTAHVLPENGSGWRRRDESVYYDAFSGGVQEGYLQSTTVDAAPGGFHLTTMHEYDAVGNLVRTVDPRSNDVLYTFNALDQIVSEQSKLAGGYGGVAQHRYRRDTAYDANDNVVRVDVRDIDETGATSATNPDLTTLQEFDVLNRMTRSTREVALGQNVVVDYQYDANGNRTLTRYGMATSGAQGTNVLRELYDERDLLFRSIRAEADIQQSTAQFDWDGNANPKAERRGLESGPRVTTYVYDAYDRRLSATDPMGNVTEHHYDANGNLGGEQSLAVPNPFGTRVLGELVDVAGSAANVRLREETFFYDANDRCISAVTKHFDPATQLPIGDGQSVTQTNWTGTSRVRSVVDDHGHTTQYTYDTAGRLRVLSDAKLNQLTYSYDANSNAVSVESIERSDLNYIPQSFFTIYQYDALDRLIRTTDNQGQTATNYYDSRDNLRKVVDKRGNVTRYAYDGLDRLIKTTSELTNTGAGGGTIVDFVITQQGWDASSRLASSSDDDGHVMTYQYDALDRLILVDRPDCTSESSEYDVHDCLVYRVDANQTVVTTQYDALRRPLTRAVSYGSTSVTGTTTETYQYDGLSRIVLAEDDDSRVTRAYDSMSNVLVDTQRVLPSGPIRTVTCTYDGVGNRTQATYPGGRVITFTYDALDRLSSVSDVSGSIATYKYVGQERVERLDQGNGTRTDYGYDSLPRLVRTTLSRPATGTVLEDHTHMRDSKGNKTGDSQLVDPFDSRTYAYDSLDRMIQSTSSLDACTTNYVLDSMGDRLATSGCLGTGNYTLDPTLCAPGDFEAHQYTTTPNDSRAYDDVGNVIGESQPERNYRYDYRNRLCRFENVAQGTLATYRYDCFDRLLEWVVGGVVRRHLFMGGCIVEEQGSFGTPLATYVWGAHDELLQMLRIATKSYMHADDEGSIVCITDAAGSVVERRMYRDFGEPLEIGIDQQPDHEYVYDSHRNYSQGSGNQMEWMAEDMTFAVDTTITAIRWWGGYDYAPPPVPPSDSFIVEIYDDTGAGGLPGNLVYQQYAYNATRTATGQFAGGAIGLVDEFRYDCVFQNPQIGSAPFQAEAGERYWLVITNDPPGYQHTWGWETSSEGKGCIGYSVDWQPWQDQCDTNLALKLTTAPNSVGCPFGYMGHWYEPEASIYWTPKGCIDPRAGVFLNDVVPGLWLFPGCELQDDDSSWWEDFLKDAFKDWLKSLQELLEQGKKTGTAVIQYTVTKVTIESAEKILFELKLSDGTIVKGVLTGGKKLTIDHKELAAAFLKVEATPGWARLLKCAGWIIDILEGWERIKTASDPATAIEILQLYRDIIQSTTSAEWQWRVKRLNTRVAELIGGSIPRGLSEMGMGWIGAIGDPLPRDVADPIVLAIDRLLDRLRKELEKREKEKKAQKK